MAQTRNITLTKTIFLYIFILPLAGGLTVTSDANSTVVGEIGKNLTMQWSINLKSASSIKLIRAYVQLQLKKKTPIVFWVNGKLLVSDDGELIYGNRLKTDLCDSKFTLKINNAQYNDSGNYSISVISAHPFRIARDTVPVFVYGPPKLCMANNTNESHLKYTICGFPMPKVTWGFTKVSIIYSIIGTKRNDLYYAHDYLLYIVPEMCGKVLRFEAVGYKAVTISWRKYIKKDFDRLTVRFDASSSVVGEIGKNVTMQWSVHLKCGSSIEFIKAYVQLQLRNKTQIVTWDAGKPVVSNDGEVNYGNRLTTDLSDSKFVLKITNAQYNDSGNYFMSVITAQPLEIARRTVPVFVYGPPKLCMDNNTNGTHLTYTVCGFPVPKVTWNFMEGGVTNFINATKRNDLYYAHDYSLSVTPDMYEKALYFQAVGYKHIIISWSKKVKKDYRALDKKRKPNFWKTHEIKLTGGVCGTVMLLVVAFFILYCYKKADKRRRNMRCKESERIESLKETTSEIMDKGTDDYMLPSDPLDSGQSSPVSCNQFGSSTSNVQATVESIPPYAKLEAIVPSIYAQLNQTDAERLTLRSSLNAN